MPRNRGIHLGYYPAEHDWLELAAIKDLNGIVVLDEYHLPRIHLPGKIICYRAGSDLKHVVRDWQPGEYARFLFGKWQSKGAGWFDDLIFANEVNLEEESGFSPPALAIEKTVVWGLSVVAELKRLWPGKRIHSPALSPAPEAGDYVALYEQMRPLIEQCSILDLHDYMDCHVNLALLRSMFGKSIIVSECGRPAWGSPAYGKEMIRYWAELPNFVEWAAAFILTAPPGDFDAWRLQGTAAIQAWMGG
jgi:hypothetical protein